ncbi:hypothetical protein AVEN_126418-1 [Araneus ventricosus]|uniref:Uncharacterized protein n=1 Tax=Araneus ventricosus TaxID=182803 RepID=A0A4Y2LKP4_ARAVE|nr:hypothetical protein AVEN_126413-1 [Araneus ventricosus]GBN14553.1 hypothetical protein AVEN_126418-1 [Araneus ventricosus]
MLLKDVSANQIEIVGSDGDNERDDVADHIFHGRLPCLQVGCQENRASFQELSFALLPILPKYMCSALSPSRRGLLSSLPNVN